RGLLLEVPGPECKRESFEECRHRLPVESARAMPRKLFRKYLPSHERVRQNRWIRYFGATLNHPNLWHLNRRSVAGGVAIGMFAGLIPGPFQMLSAALLSILLRVNLPVAVATTLYTNPFTIVPLYLAAYQLGTLVLGVNAINNPSARVALLDLPASEWISGLTQWMSAMGKPFLLGLFLLALLLAVLGYVCVIAAWRIHIWWSWRKRRRTRSNDVKD
ncbi:MAG: DUF2062 domain-containing protein, partial [Burkholderiales bacterium]